MRQHQLPDPDGGGKDRGSDAASAAVDGLVIRACWHSRQLQRIISRPLAAVRMSGFAGRSSLALVVAALCLAPRTACAQDTAVTYSSWPIGFGSNLTVGQSPNAYGFPGFNSGDARGGGFSYMRTQFPNGFFVRSETGGPRFSVDG